MRGEMKELDNAARLTAGGSFIPLRGGVTHYELGNPDVQHSVVLVHGFSVPYFIYDPTFYFLANSGFRVLRYDLFGRGYSDRPRARYNLDFFVGQLEDLLDSLRLDPPVSLIGLSMGGPIVTAFAIRNPGRIGKLILIDPTGARALVLPPLLQTARVPLLAEAIISLTGTDFLLKSMADDFFDPALVAHFLERYKIQMQYRGFIRAILSTLRADMLGSFIDMYRELGGMDIPVSVFWGREDRTVPFDHSRDLLAAIRQAEFHIVEQCGHIPHYEKPDEVNPILLEFLRKA